MKLQRRALVVLCLLAACDRTDPVSSQSKELHADTATEHGRALSNRNTEEDKGAAPIPKPDPEPDLDGPEKPPAPIPVEADPRPLIDADDSYPSLPRWLVTLAATEGANRDVNEAESLKEQGAFVSAAQLYAYQAVREPAEDKWLVRLLDAAIQSSGEELIRNGLSALHRRAPSKAQSFLKQNNWRLKPLQERWWFEAAMKGVDASQTQGRFASSPDERVAEARRPGPLMAAVPLNTDLSPERIAAIAAAIPNRPDPLSTRVVATAVSPRDPDTVWIVYETSRWHECLRYMEAEDPTYKPETLCETKKHREAPRGQVRREPEGRKGEEVVPCMRPFIARVELGEDVKVHEGVPLASDEVCDVTKVRRLTFDDVDRDGKLEVVVDVLWTFLPGPAPADESGLPGRTVQVLSDDGTVQFDFQSESAARRLEFVDGGTKIKITSVDGDALPFEDESKLDVEHFADLTKSADLEPEYVRIEVLRYDSTSDRWQLTAEPSGTPEPRATPVAPETSNHQGPVVPESTD